MDIFQIIRNDNEETITSALENIDIHIVNGRNENLLHTAIAYKPEIASILIDRNVDVNHHDEKGETPLHYCAAYGYYEIALKIIRNGANINIKDKFGNNPIWVAAFNARGKYDIVKLFKMNGGDAANKNNFGSSAIDFANQINDIELLKILEA